MFERRGSAAFVGQIDGHRVETEYVWVNGLYKNFFSWPKTTSKTFVMPVDEDCLNGFGCRWNLPEEMCVKKQGTALSKENKYWRGRERKVIEIIVKKINRKRT